MSVGPPTNAGGIAGTDPIGTTKAPIPAPPTPRAPKSKPDRRAFDNARVRARFLDWLLFLALYLGLRYYLAKQGIDYRLWHVIPLLLVELTYFYLCEAVWGQTLGKRQNGIRVVSTDGGVPSLNAIATRNAIRIVEEPMIALLTMVGSRGRRQRVGDFVAGTAVVATTGAAPPRRGGRLWIYPAIWTAGAAIFIALVLHPGESTSSGFRLATPVVQTPQSAEGKAFADRINGICRDGVHAQVAEVGQIVKATKVYGTDANRATAAGNRALADELQRIYLQVREVHSPPETLYVFERWLRDLRANVDALRQLAAVSEHGDATARQSVIQGYAQPLVEVNQISAQLGFGECMAQEIDPES